MVVLVGFNDKVFAVAKPGGVVPRRNGGAETY